MKFMYFSIKYRYRDILLKKNNNINLIYNRLFCFNHTCYCVGMVSASRYVASATHYQSRSSMNIQGLIQLNSTELAETVPITLVLLDTSEGRLKCFVYM